MATYKNLTARGVSGEITSAHFLFWDPLYISVTNGARNLKFGTLVGIYAYYSARYKNLSARGVWGNQELPLFISGPPHISEINRARKLKFGMLVGICRYYGDI